MVATLQRKCSGGIVFVILTKIFTKIIVPRNYFVIISARMVETTTISMEKFIRHPLPFFYHEAFLRGRGGGPCTWVKPGRFGSFFVLCFLALGGHCLQMLCLPGFGTHPNTQNLPHFRAFPASIQEHSPPKCLFFVANAKLPNRPGFALLRGVPLRPEFYVPQLFIDPPAPRRVF